MRYFLPRYFELIAQNDPPDNCGIDICLRRLAQADWRAKWPEPECAIIDRFFAELMRDCLERTELVRWPVGWRLAFDLADVLTLVVTAHGDIDDVLAVWDAAPDPGAAIHMAALRDDVLHHTARTHFHSPYLDEFPQAADKIGAFLMRPQTIPRIEAGFFMVTDPRLQQLMSDAIYPD